MQDSIQRVELEAFFDAFANAFAAFDGAEIARRYASPYVALQGDGALACFQTSADIGAYFQRVLDGYRNEGCASCRFQRLDITPLGRHSTLASLSWELLDAKQKVLRAWRESYTLRRRADRLEIFASVDHVE